MSNHYRMRRGWMENPALSGGPYDRRSAWAWLIEKANWKPGPVDAGGRTVEVERGQLCHSYRYLSKAWDWPVASVQRFINRLKTDTMIDTALVGGRLLITICNYSKYQARAEAEKAATDTARDTAAIRERYRSKKGSNKDIKAPAYSDSPEGVQGEESAERRAGGWSPKVDDPLQIDLEEAIAAAVARDAAAQAEALESAPVDLGAPEASAVEVLELEPEAIAPAAPTLTAPRLRIVEEPAAPPPPAPPALPLELSLEGEVLPPGVEPELGLGLPAIAPSSPPAGRNVVPFKAKPALGNDPDFLEWYAAYPRKKKPLDAARAYAEARRRATREELLAGALQCREEAAARPAHERRFVSYPATWLRAGAWGDEAERIDHGNQASGGNQYDRQSSSDQRPARGGDATASLYRRLFGRGD